MVFNENWICDTASVTNSIKEVWFNELIKPEEKDLILSRQLKEIIELKEWKLQERKVLSIQIMIENSCRDNKSFDSTLKQFSLNDELRRLFLASLDLYVQNNDYGVLRHIFTKKNWEGSFDLKIPKELCTDLNWKVSALNLFWDLDKVSINWKECTKKDLVQLNIFDLANAPKEVNNPKIDKLFKRPDIKDYCKYFNIDEKACREDLNQALYILDNLPPSMKRYITEDKIVILLSIIRETKRVGLQYVSSKNLIALALVESSFWKPEYINSEKYKWPMQVWDDVVWQLIQSRSTFNQWPLKWMLKSLGLPNISSLTKDAWVKPKEGITMWILYFSYIEKEVEWNGLPNSLDKSYKSVCNYVKWKGIKIEETVFKKVVASIKSNENDRNTFLSLKRYNWNPTYALAVMCLWSKIKA
jgi:hypothetical protein